MPMVRPSVISVNTAMGCHLLHYLEGVKFNQCQLVISVIVVLPTLQWVASACSAANSLSNTVRNQTSDHTHKLMANCDHFDCDQGILVAQESCLNNMCVACPRPLQGR